MPQTSDIISRLEAIEAALADSTKKDAIIRQMHTDLTNRREDIIAQVRRPVMQALIKVASRIYQVDSASQAMVVLDNPEYEALRAQVKAAAEYAIEILADDFDVETISPVPGQPYDRKLHVSIEIIPTSDPQLDRTIAEIVDPGFLSRTDGSILRQATVKTYRLQ